MKQTVNSVYIYHKIISVAQTVITCCLQTDCVGCLWVNTWERVLDTWSKCPSDA